MDVVKAREVGRKIYTRLENNKSEQHKNFSLKIVWKRFS